MKEDKLGKLSMELSVEVLNLVKDLRNKKENIISNQIGRSATSLWLTVPTAKPVADFHRQVITHTEHTTKRVLHQFAIPFRINLDRMCLLFYID